MATARFVKVKKTGYFDKKSILKQLAAKYRLGFFHPKDTGPVVQTSRTKARQHKKTKIFFFNKVSKKKGSIQTLTLKKLGAKRIIKAFNLSPTKRLAAMKKYNQKLPLTRVEGIYIWALLQAINPKTSLLKLYQTSHPKMVAINKQLQWQHRQTTLLVKALEYAARTRNFNIFLPKPQNVFTRVTKRSLKRARSLLLKTRQQFVIWRRVFGKRARHWKYKDLQYKLRSQVPHSLRLSASPYFGHAFKTRGLKLFRIQYAYKKTYQPLSLIRDFSVRDAVRIQRLRLKKERLEVLLRKLKQSRKPSRRQKKKNDVMVLQRRYAKVVNRLKFLQAPLPWWKKKQVATQQNLHQLQNNFSKAFKKASYRNNNNIKKRLRIVRWFKLKTVHYNLFKSTAQWRGLSYDIMFQQAFKRLHAQKTARKNTKKRGFLFSSPINGLKKGIMQRAVQKVALRSVVYVAKPAITTAITGDLLSRKPIFFNLYKATKALDFNKFFKVNKIVARSVTELGNDIYTQYLANLQTLATNAVIISADANKKNVHTARVLRKYMKLLRTYFSEVYDNKFSKKVPASSAMHWIREYLRLTSGIKRRISLWNRFNKVSFHFKPKAKEDEKRGRKKKVLFKAKILFDRLFQWLYAQPNARYALAEPIQNGLVRDYIVRNQFIFKKQFKVKLPSKLI